MSADPENEYFCDGITKDIISALTKLRGLRIDGGRLRVSQDGGTSPAWSPDGRELFYRNGEAMMAASFAADALSIVGRRSLFEGAYLTANGRNYDVAPSGN